MKADDFVHLHVHTEHSTLDGINRVKTLPSHVRDNLGQTAIACTEHGTCSGTYAFYKQCMKDGVKPILGMEAYYTVGDRSVRELDDDGNKYYHLVLLALNNTGLHNLFKLSSRAYTEGMYYKPRIDDDLLAQHSEGIAATSSCLGSRASQLILAGRNKEAEKLILHHSKIFKDRFFIEVQLHTDKEQQLVNQQLVRISQDHNLPIIVTNDCLLPGQPIMTSTGAKPVEDITRGDMVLTDKGRYKPVVVPVTRQVNEKIYRLHLQQTTAQQDILLTGNHPVLVSDKDGATAWTEAQNVTEEDYATFPRQKLLTGQKVFRTHPCQNTWHPNYNEWVENFWEVDIDEDIAWVLGWFTAEGSTWLQDSKRSGFNFALSLKEEAIANRIAEIIKNKFNYQPKVHIRANWIEVRGYNLHTAEFFADSCGIGSKNKFINPNVMQSEHLEIYLKALFQGDGTNTRTSQLATASFNLAFGVKQALANLGFWGNVSYIQRKCQTGVFDQWLISWTPEIKQRKWLVFDDFIARKITTVSTEDYTGPVHNFEVADDNTYVTNICVHNCHYTLQSDKELHEQTLAMQTGAVMSDPPWNPESKGEKGGRTRFSFGPIDVHVAHHNWMWHECQLQGLPYDVIKNTRHIADMVDSDSYFEDRRNRYPKFRGLPEGTNPWDALENLCKHKLNEKFKGNVPQSYKERLMYELKVIKRMGFYDYFLIMWEIVEAANKLDVIIGPGRGSAGGSLVAYALGITKVDPMQYGLLLERFLNEGRAAQPLIFTKKMAKEIEQLPNPGHKCSHHH